MSDSDTVISVRDIGKRYTLGMTLSHDTLRDKIAHGMKSLFTRFQRSHDSASATASPSTPISASQPFSVSASSPKDFWALRNVSFDIKRGEVVGIIGRNGAGKSTLLKILSQITEPTEGEIRMRGRVASLLEVGIGMHPELSGRENVYLNGSILGMTKAEIDNKYDEIVAFAGIADFMGTPIKRYSSGMRVRLGFAIAAHLEPEILIIDEVLAVGDLNFQKKCLGKMEEVANAGRTVLFVSHRMEAIRALCSRTVLLQEGHVVLDGPTSETIQAYHQLLRETEFTEHSGIHDTEHRRGSGSARFTDISVVNSDGRETFTFEVGEDVRLVLDYEVLAPVACLYVMLGIRTNRTREFVTTSRRHAISESPLPAGVSGTVQMVLPSLKIRPGEYPLYFGLADQEFRAYDVVDDLMSPLMIHTKETPGELGYDPTNPPGYFDIKSSIELIC